MDFGPCARRPAVGAGASGAVAGTAGGEGPAASESRRPESEGRGGFYRPLPRQGPPRRATPWPSRALLRVPGLKQSKGSGRTTSTMQKFKSRSAPRDLRPATGVRCPSPAPERERRGDHHPRVARGVPRLTAPRPAPAAPGRETPTWVAGRYQIGRPILTQTPHTRACCPLRAVWGPRPPEWTSIRHNSCYRQCSLRLTLRIGTRS